MKNILLETDCKNNRYKTAETLIYKKVRVPYGYSSDGLTKGIDKYKPRGMRGAIIHDYVCDTNCISYKEGRQYAKEIWMDDGCSWWQVQRWYRALVVYDFVLRRK